MAGRGDKKAQQQVHQAEQHQKKETDAQGRNQTERKAQQQPHGEQVGSAAKPQSEGASKQQRKPAGGKVPNQSEKTKSKGKGKP
jgi:hypothetical protein